MKCVAALSLLVLGAAAASQKVRRPIKETVDFNREIRPILANTCFACHGADTGSRQAGLRLDTFAGATAKRGTGAAIVPGKLAKSLLVQRIISSDSSKRMPPASSGKQLRPLEISL